MLAVDTYRIYTLAYVFNVKALSSAQYIISANVSLNVDYALQQRFDSSNNASRNAFKDSRLRPCESQTDARKGEIDLSLYQDARFKNISLRFQAAAKNTFVRKFANLK